MSKETFTVILGDLIASREAPSREQRADSLRRTVDDIAARYRSEFHAPLTLSRGIDEVSGVLYHPRHSYRICLELNDAIGFSSFRFAVAVGALDVGVESGEAPRMDGPAFHAAADLMEKAKQQGRLYLFDLERCGETTQRLLNEVAHLASLLSADWSDHQREVGNLYRRLGSQKEVARELDVTQQAVSKTLRRMRWHDYMEANDVINQTLTDLPL